MPQRGLGSLKYFVLPESGRREAPFRRLCVCFQATLVGNSEFPAALFAAAGQYFAAIF